MQIVDLTPDQEKLYCMCLEDWSPDMRESGDHKEKWYARMKDQGLRVKLALDDNGTVAGMIHYIPVELSFVEGKDLYFINCIWVHGHKQGIGNYQKKGLGKELLKAAEADTQSLGAKGLVAWGLSLPFFMRASWFKKQGYRPVDKMGMQVLLWKTFTNDAVPPKWIHRKKKPAPHPGQVTVSAFMNGWCPAQNITFERAKRASAEFPGKVVFQEYHTFDRGTFLEWGISDALFVDEKEIPTGPPPTYEKVWKEIEKRVRKLK